MPSGFTQDNNQLSPNYYRVSIDLSGYPTTDGNTNGGVTPTAANFFSTANLPSTLVKGKQRARGNMRFRNVVNRLTGLSDCQILDITITEANGDAQATALSFTIRYERDEFIQATGTAVDGSTAITTIALKIRDTVARGILDETSANAAVYNGTDGTDGHAVIAVQAPDTAGNVWADVTVTLNSDTTLVA
jgi:hypothetical protein